MASTVLVKFNAGKMSMTGTKVKPDPRKGMVVISYVDQMAELTWRDVATQTKEDTALLFPGSCKFSKVAQSQDRVYILKFENSTRKLFFWMQDADATKDSDICRRVNLAIDDPQKLIRENRAAAVAAAAGRPAAGSGGSAAAATVDQQLAALAAQQGIDPALFAQFMESGDASAGDVMDSSGDPMSLDTPAISSDHAAPAHQAVSDSTTPARPGPGPAAVFEETPLRLQPQVSLSDHQQQQQPQPQPFISSALLQSALNNAGTGAGGGRGEDAPRLTDMVDAASVQAILSDPQNNLNLESLKEYLPPGTSTSQIVDLIRSPPFVQFLTHFDYALSTGHLSDLMRQFNLDPTIASPEAFLRAIQKQVDEKNSKK